MKKKFILFSATLGIAYLGLTAYSTGPAGSSLNRTGSDGITASCTGGGCHDASSAKTTGLITITDKATSTVVTNGKYVPGKIYTVHVAGSNSSGLTKFGFQTTVTKGDHSLAGTVKATSSNTAARPLGTTTIVEHKSVLPATGGALVAEFEWTAPAKGAGTATFYGIINAVNGDGNTSGDQPSMGLTAVFTEDAPSGIAPANALAKTNIYPNPCTDVLHIEQGQGDRMNVFICDLAGRQLINTTTEGDINVSALQSGTYIIRLDNGTEQQVSTFIRK